MLLTLKGNNPNVPFVPYVNDTFVPFKLKEIQNPDE